MDRHEEFIRRAKQSLAVGEHVLKVTFPLLKEVKLLLATLERIHDAHTALLQAVLTYERELRSIPPFHANFESMHNVLSLRLAKKYSPSDAELELMRKIDQTIKFHKEAAVAFGRKGDLVLASDDYVIHKITEEFVRDAMRQTQIMITNWSRLLTK